MAEPYTHNFKFSLGDGGKFITGEIEFNQDGKMSFRMDTWSEPIDEDSLAAFKELTTLLKKIFYEFGGIKKIVVKEKSQSE